MCIRDSHQNGSLRVCDHIRTVHLHQIRFEPEAGLTGTGAADHQHIFVSGGLGALGVAVHGQALGFGQNHIVLEHRVDVGLSLIHISVSNPIRLSGCLSYSYRDNPICRWSERA